MLFDESGECLGGRGLWYGSSAPTNNIAEAQSLVEAMEYVEEVGWTAPLVILGDSQLIVNFVLRKYKPALRELVLRV